MNAFDPLRSFEELIALRYQLYNSLFLTLPFEPLERYGNRLPLFSEACREGIQQNLSPNQIVNDFLQEQMPEATAEERASLLFLFLQQVERQVVLFDALEDIAFSQLHDRSGTGTLNHFWELVQSDGCTRTTARILGDHKVRLVLTAHPTQFYPESVLGIIHDLGNAIHGERLADVKELLLQLGLTSFKNQEAPTPASEATSLLQRTFQVFYPVLTDIQARLFGALGYNLSQELDPVIELGFWPGGDRDGNPYVTVEITEGVAEELRLGVLDCYLNELESLQRRLTFAGVEKKLVRIKEKLEATRSRSVDGYPNAQALIADLLGVQQVLERDHQGHFIRYVEHLIIALRVFGFYFASLDLRQDSRPHGSTVSRLIYLLSSELPKRATEQPYDSLSDDEKVQVLESLLALPAPKFDLDKFSLEEVQEDVIESMRAVAGIQERNGERGMHRYVISNTQGMHHVLEVMLLAHWATGDLAKWHVDIVPLFETVEDLESAEETMARLYQSPSYKKHLERRASKQTVMLGFSDGTKDGGYFTCNWSIFKCRRRLAAVSEQAGVWITFFDGRGGPPARGGGNTHRFYRALGYQMPQKDLQITIQGQTISSKFGTQDAASFNLEQLFTAGIEPYLFPKHDEVLLAQEEILLDELSKLSHGAYLALKEHPLFVRYLEEVTPLRFYGDLNIASRPSSRKESKQLVFEDLRAIPFVGSWSQMRQNVPGFYGLGTALQELMQRGETQALKRLYERSELFRSLLDNAAQALCKSYFSLTQYLADDETYGEFWSLIAEEEKRSVQTIQEISGMPLLENDLVNRASIELRESLILPLLVIQQYALINLRKVADANKQTTFRKLILKSLPANINASRNSA